MRRNWSTNFIENIRGSLDDDWTWRSGIGHFSTGVLLLLSYGFRAGINGVGTGFTSSGDKSSGGGVSPCTESAVRLLIGH